FTTGSGAGTGAAAIFCAVGMSFFASAGGAGLTKSHQYITAKPNAMKNTARPPALTYGFDRRSPRGSKRMFWLGTTMRGAGPLGAASARRESMLSASRPSTLAVVRTKARTEVHR